MPLGRLASRAIVLTTTLIVTASTASAATSSQAPAAPASPSLSADQPASGRAGAVTALSLAGSTTTSGRAALPPVTSAATVDAARKQLQALDRQVLAATAAYNEAQVKFLAQDRLVRQVRIEVDAASARLDSARTRTGQLASASYRRGALDPMLIQVLLAEHPDAVLTQASMMGRLNHRQAVVVRRSRQAADDLAQKESELALQLRTLQDARAAAEATKRQLSERRAAAAAVLASLEAKERQRLLAERRAASARAVTTVSRRAARVAIPTAGSCPASGGRGAEGGLTPATLRIMRCGLATFPQIDRALGLGKRGNATDHDDGRAVDFMIPNYRSGTGNDLGWRVAEWAAKQRGIKYVIFDQKIYIPGRSGWRPMENRGSDTANHRDHVHVSVN